MGGSNLLVVSPCNASDNAKIGAYNQPLHIVGLLQWYFYACGTWIQVREEIEGEIIESWFGHSLSLSHSGVILSFVHSPDYLWEKPIGGTATFYSNILWGNLWSSTSMLHMPKVWITSTAVLVMNPFKFNQEGLIHYQHN